MEGLNHLLLLSPLLLVSLSSLCLCIASYNPSSVLWLVPLAAWGCDEVLLLSSLVKVVVGVWSLRSSLYLLYLRNPVCFSLYTSLPSGSSPPVYTAAYDHTNYHNYQQQEKTSCTSQQSPAFPATMLRAWTCIPRAIYHFFCETPILLEDRLDSWA